MVPRTGVESIAPDQPLLTGASLSCFAFANQRAKSRVFERSRSSLHLGPPTTVSTSFHRLSGGLPQYSCSYIQAAIFCRIAAWIGSGTAALGKRVLDPSSC